MAIYKRDIVDINLETGNIHRSFLNHTIGYKDQQADHFGIRTFRNGEPVDLTGVSVQGVFMPPQGSPIAITSGNIVDGNVAEVVLPQACYNYNGNFTLAIKLVDSGNSVTGTMRIVDGVVDNTHASGTVAPTSAVPTYQEILSTYDAMVAATAAANGAIAAPYSSSSTYAVGDYCIKDGELKRCIVPITTAEVWTAAHWTSAKIGTDVSNLKSAFDADLDTVYKVPKEFVGSSDGTFAITSGGINSDGKNNTNTARSRSYFFDVIPGGSYLIELTDPTYYIVCCYGYSETAYAAKVDTSIKVDDNCRIYHASSNAVCARMAFAIKADNTQAMTDSDRTAILSALKMYTIVDDSLSIENAPADAKTVGMFRTDFETLKNAITDEEIAVWADSGTQATPNGWNTGYYNSETGASSTSNVYIKTTANYYYSEPEATLMEVTAPDGYAVRAFEYKPDGTYVGYHGALTGKNGKHYFFEYEKGNKFRFAMGRFTNEADCISHYSDANFLATCVVKFYVLSATIGYDVIEQQIENISTNLDAIFYTENITYEASQWRTGYYGYSTGNYNSSLKYICLKSTEAIAKANMTRLVAKAPNGYYIAVHEYTSGGVFLKSYGNVKKTNEVNVAATDGNIYRLSVGGFVAGTAGDYLTDAFVGQIQVSVDELKLPSVNTKLNRTGDFEWFSVTVDRPLAFGGEEVIDPTEEQEIECVLRLPTSYTRAGTPTRLVLACHGASGYVDKNYGSSGKWYNAEWKDFMDDLLSAGYAVFDSNVLPTSTGTSQMGFAVGSPLYVNVLKKAYDYIVANYNVYDKIFAHGTSMGGVGATAFSHTYPELVLAESSFAGRDVLRYLYSLANNDGSDRFAISYGYDDLDALTADKFSHVDGNSPSLCLRKVNSDGTVTLPPDRATDYSNWLSFWSAVANHQRTDNAGLWIGNRSVPFKAWNAWADNESYTKLQEILKQAYTAGSACPYYTIAYDISDEEVAYYREQFDNPDLTRHSFMSYGMIYDMRDQLIAWYKRWE